MSTLGTTTATNRERIVLVQAVFVLAVTPTPNEGVTGPSVAVETIPAEPAKTAETDSISPSVARFAGTGTISTFSWQRPAEPSLRRGG